MQHAHCMLRMDGTWQDIQSGHTGVHGKQCSSQLMPDTIQAGA
jgi:hypothetical protein